MVGVELCDFQPAEPVESVDKYSHTNTEIHTDTQNCLYAQRQVNLLNKVFFFRFVSWFLLTLFDAVALCLMEQPAVYRVGFSIN